MRRPRPPAGRVVSPPLVTDVVSFIALINTPQFSLGSIIISFLLCAAYHTHLISQLSHTYHYIRYNPYIAHIQIQVTGFNRSFNPTCPRSVQILPYLHTFTPIYDQPTSTHTHPHTVRIPRITTTRTHGTPTFPQHRLRSHITNYPI